MKLSIGLILFPAIINSICWFGMGFLINWMNLMIVGAIVSAIFIKKTISNNILSVPDNTITITFNPYWPRKLDNGATDYNEYTPGDHFVFDWEQISPIKIPMNDTRTFTKKQTVSTLDEELEFNSVATVALNLSKVSVFMSHGSNPKDVWSTVEKNIMAIVVNKLEFEMRSKTSDEILKNASPIKNSVDDIIKEAEAICSKFGVILKTVKVGDINYSKEIAKARSVAKEVKIINQSIRETMNEFNIKDAEKAMSHVRVVSGNSSGLEINLTTPGGSQGNYTFNVSAGATNNKSKKENDKGKDEK